MTVYNLKVWLIGLALFLCVFQGNWLSTAGAQAIDNGTPAPAKYLAASQAKPASALGDRVSPAISSVLPVQVAAGDDRLQYFGRWDHSLPGQVRTGRGAVYVKANFTGSSLAVELEDKSSWWRYSIDGQAFKRFQPEQRAVRGAVLLAEKLPAGRHHLLLARETEGNVGLSTIKGWRLAPGGTLLAGDRVSGRRLEFVGDSIMAGAFAYGPGPYTEQENGYMAYGPQLARLLNADWSVVAKSGEGVVRNYLEGTAAGQGTAAAKQPTAEKKQTAGSALSKAAEKIKTGPVVHARENYLRTLFTEPKPLWKNQAFAPQLILVSYGSNDFSENYEVEKARYVQGYVRLLQTIRKKNPRARIVCLEPVPYTTNRQAGYWAHLAVQERQAEGDELVYYWTVNRPRPCLEASDFAGDEEHPLIKGHTKLARYLKDKVARLLGW